MKKRIQNNNNKFKETVTYFVWSKFNAVGGAIVYSKIYTL